MKKTATETSQRILTDKEVYRQTGCKFVPLAGSINQGWWIAEVFLS